jgi:hypothetical protein
MIFNAIETLRPASLQYREICTQAMAQYIIEYGVDKSSEVIAFTV